ncbi:MAG: tetratricopeptide repeat protein [Sandaracinaceae bacterium]|nr:tetratricopeptide repeat protein [Sandaracinaceae bacterium]
MRSLLSTLISLVLALGLAHVFAATPVHAQETELPHLREAAQAAPRDAAAQRALGIALLRAGRYREARQQLERTSRLSRGSLEALFDVARVSFAERDHRASETACRAMGRAQKAAPLTRVCQARSDLVWARSARAFEELQQALAADPSLYEGLYALGEAHRLRAATADAEAAYQRAIAARATSAEPHLGLGRLYAAVGRRDEAVRALRRALELDGTDPEIQFELGRLLADDEGRALLARAVAGRPSWPEAQTSLGDLLAAASQNEPAEAAYRAAIAARADHEPAHAGLGRVLAARGEDAGAEASLRRALELVSNDQTAMMSLADVLARTQRVEEAYESYRAAYGFDARNAEPMLRAARLALGQERDVLASGFLDSILRNQPENGEALALYGDVMVARRDRTQARQYYEHALRAGARDRARIETALRGL